MIETSAIVLAGGSSRRFGRDKLVESLDGEALIERAIRAAATVADEVVVAVPPAGPSPALAAIGDRHGVAWARDAVADRGPLEGVAAGLEVVRGSIVLVVAGDMPSLRSAVLQRLIAALAPNASVDGEPGAGVSARHAAVLLLGGRPEPVPIAVARDPARTAVADLRRNGQRRLLALVEALDAHALPEAAWRHLDPAGATLRDVDRPEDLRA